MLAFILRDVVSSDTKNRGGWQVKGPEEVNQAVRTASPAFFDALSDLGRRVAYPPDIPFQAAQARDKTYNGTIGQITDGRGVAVSLPSMSTVMAGLDDDDLSRAFLYSPVPGIDEKNTSIKSRMDAIGLRGMAAYHGLDREFFENG